MFGGFIFCDYAVSMVGFIVGTFFAFTFVTAAVADKVNLPIILFCSHGICVVLMGQLKMSSLGKVGQGKTTEFGRLTILYLGSFSGPFSI